MVLITTLQVSATPESLHGKERDTIELTWEERRWTRKRVRTARGRDVAFALPTGSLLRPGGIVAVEDDWYLVIEGRPESVLAVAPRDHAEAVRIAFDVGNRHFPLAVEGDALLVPDDTAMEQLLTRLGARWQRTQAVFEPEAGGASQGHTHE